MSASAWRQCSPNTVPRTDQRDIHSTRHDIGRRLSVETKGSDALRTRDKLASFSVFLPREAMRKRSLYYAVVRCPSFRPSACLSVTFSSILSKRINRGLRARTHQIENLSKFSF